MTTIPTAIGASFGADPLAQPPVVLLAGVPFGAPLIGHVGSVLWGAWGVVAGRPVLATGGLNSARLWDLDTSTELQAAMRDTALPWGSWGVVAGRPVLATGRGDGIAWVWDPEDRAPRAVGPPSIGDAPGVSWGCWGEVAGRPVLAVGGQHRQPTGVRDGTVRLCDPATGAAIGVPFTGHSGPVWWGAWGIVADRAVLATGGADGTVRLWDPATGAAIGAPLTGHRGPVQWGSWGVVAERPVLATGSEYGDVWLWDPATGAAIGAPLTGHVGGVMWGSWGIVDDRPVLATGGADGDVRLWDPATGAAIDVAWPVERTGGVVWGSWGTVADRPVLATGGGSGEVWLWDPATAAAIGAPLIGHVGGVLWGSWGVVADRPVLATGGEDATVRLWEVIEDRPRGRALPPYRSDVTTAVDQLERVADAAAVAELITAKSAQPPLAVGLFGDWGEGKSHFLALLQQQVDAAARPNNPLAHSAVRQVRFNAWHYAETDLWASLVTELFAQLATPTGVDSDREQRQYSRLAAELVAERGLPQRLQAARQRRDDLRAALGQPAELWESLPPEQQQELRLLAGDKPERMYRQAALTVAALTRAGKSSWRLVRGVPLATALRLAAGGVLLLAVAAGFVLGLPAAWKWFAALPGIVSVVAAAQLVSRVAAATRRRANTAWKTALRFGMQQRQRLQSAADAADAEVTALQREMQDFTAAGQLAGMVADRDASSDYRSRLSMMSRIRQDFVHMSRLLAQAGAEPPSAAAPAASHDSPAAGSEDAAGDELPRIDRIVVYIDDLDRCPPSRVVEMLEAIYLLLAVDLFVVVVAIDPRWLLSAVTARYRDLLATTSPSLDRAAESVDPDDESLWQSTPTQYLEKIFQVVLTLPPLDTGGYQRLLHSLVGARDRDELPPPPPPQPTPDGVPDTPRAATIAVAAGTTANAAPTVGADMFGVALPAARVVERVDPFTLDPDELRLLDLLGPPHLVTTPRQVKRLANSYGLLAALRHGHRDTDLTENTGVVQNPSGDLETVTYWPYRASMVLLGALVAFPSLGPGLFVHLHDTAETAQRSSWTDFLATLRPTHGPNGYTNRGTLTISAVQAQQWQALVTGLDKVGQLAAEHGLPLPEPVSAWAAWIITVGRLSFPTGRVVNELDRLRPLPPTIPMARPVTNTFVRRRRRLS